MADGYITDPGLLNQLESEEPEDYVDDPELLKQLDDGYVTDPAIIGELEYGDAKDPVGRSYAGELATALQQNKLFGSATAALQRAPDKGIRRKKDGDWDLPVMKPDNDGPNLGGAIVAGVEQPLGIRMSPALGNRAAYDATQKTFHDFQQANNLSDEEMQTAWSDLGNIQRTWGEDEKLRVLSNGAIIPNPSNTDWLDDTKAADLVRNAEAPDAAKAAVLRGLPKLQTDLAAEKTTAYEAGTTLSNMGKDVLPFGGAMEDIKTPSVWAGENGRDDIGTPTFVKDYESYLQSVPGGKRYMSSIGGSAVLGFNKVAVTALGLAGLAGSDTATELAGEGSEAATIARGGMENTGLAGQVVEEIPSIVTQVVTGRLMGAGAALLPEQAASYATKLGVFGMAGMQSAGMTYADEIAQGTPEAEAREKAAKAGVSTAIVTAVVGGTGDRGGVERVAAGLSTAEGVTLGQLFKIAKDNGVKNLVTSPELRKFAKEVIMAAGGEATEEGIDQYLQAFLTADPDDSLAGAWEEAKQAAVVTAVVGGSVDVAANNLAAGALPDAPASARAAIEPVETKDERETETTAPEETGAAGQDGLPAPEGDAGAAPQPAEGVGEASQEGLPETQGTPVEETLPATGGGEPVATNQDQPTDLNPSQVVQDQPVDLNETPSGEPQGGLVDTDEGQPTVADESTANSLPDYEDFSPQATGGVTPDQLIKENPDWTYEQAMEAASRRNRASETKPRKFKQAPVGTVARDSYGELYVLVEAPLDSVVQTEGTDQTNDTVTKYSEWLDSGSPPLPANGVQNISVHGGAIKLNDGHHRFSAARKSGLKSHPVWVNLTDPDNDARPLKETGGKLERALRLLEEKGASVGRAPTLTRDPSRRAQMTPEELKTAQKGERVADAREALRKAQSGEERPSVFSNGFKAKAPLVRARKAALEEAESADVKPDIWNTVIAASYDQEPVLAALVDGLDQNQTHPDVPSVRDQMVDNLTEKGYVREGAFFIHKGFVAQQNEGQPVVAEEPSAPTPETGAAAEERGADYSPEALADTFDLQPDQAAAVDALVQSMGLDTSRIKLRKGGSPGEGALAQDEARPFYSKMGRVLDEKLTGRNATPEQIMAVIDPQRGSGVKAEEVKWTGIEQKIDELARDNGGKVPMDELRAWLAADGSVRLEEVDSDDKKYAQYVLPGGENYREVVLAMPSKAKIEEVVYHVGYATPDGSMPGSTTPFNTREEAQAFIESTMRGAKIFEKKRTSRRSWNDKTGEYTSSHFPDVPNYVAHMRTNERTDADGKPGLFIEEIQSDRHQEGRKKGYRGDAPKGQLPDQWKLVKTSLGFWVVENEQGVRVSITTPVKQEAIDDALAAKTNGLIPDAPFRTSWPLAMFKRALRDAVASGKEWIGWTVGETQNDRFDLSKQVDYIYSEATESGAHLVDIKPTDGDKISLRVKDGKIDADSDQFAGQQLEDVIGKDMAAKVLSVTPRSDGRPVKFTGNDLKVGGSGMKGFYDNMLPKEVQKYMKQWGGKVEPSKIEADGATPIWRVTITPEMKKGVSQGQALFQNRKGSYEILENGDTLLRGLESPDISTGLHEIAHVARRQLLTRGTEVAGITDEDIDVVEEWAGAVDGWTTEAEEKFARGFERYVMEGKAPTSSLKDVFAKLGAWLRDVYMRVQGSPVDIEISPGMRRVFDKMVSRMAPAEPAVEAVPGSETAAVEPLEAPAPEPPAEQGPDPEVPANTTSLKNESTERDRKSLGFDPAVTPERRAHEQVMREAIDTYNADTGKASRVITEVLKQPRTLSDSEDALLKIELSNRKSAQTRAQDAYFKATGEVEKAAARVELDKAREATLEALQAAKLAGTEWGRAGAMRRREIYDDYSLAALEARFRIDALNGGEMTPEQEKMIAGMAEKLRQAADRSSLFDEAEEARAEGNGAAADRLTELAGLVETLTNDIVRAKEKLEAKSRTTTARKLVRKHLDPQVEAAKARIAARKNPPTSGPDETVMLSGLDPEMVSNLRDHAIVLAGKLVDKALTLQEATNAMVSEFGDWLKPYMEDIFRQARTVYHESASTVQGTEAPTPETILDGIDPESPLDRADVWQLARAHVIAGLRGRAVLDAVFEDLSGIIPDITRDQVAESFTDYGKVIYPSKNEASKELQRVKSIERIALQIQDVREGRMPKRTGFQRGEQDAEVRELNKKLRELLRESGLQVTDPEKQLQSTLGAIKRRMANEIEELQRAIDSRTPRVTEGRTPTPLDEEGLKLKAQLEAKREEYNGMFGGRTQEQRVAAVIKSLDRQIAEEEQMLRDGVLRKPKADPVTSPEIEVRREKLRKMREHRRELYAAPHGLSPLEVAKEAARKTSERLQQMIATGDVAIRRKEKIEPDAELAALWDANEALRDQIAEMRKAVPLTDGEVRAAIGKEVAAAERTAARIQAKLDAGDLSVETKPLSPRAEAVAADPRVQNVRNQIKQLNKELAARRRAALPKKSPEQIRLDRILSAAKRAQADLKRRIAARDVTPKGKPGPFADPKMREAARNARRETSALKRKFNEIVLEESLKSAPPLVKAARASVDAMLRLPRAVMASLDVSGLGRQGWTVLITRPSLVAKNLKSAFAFSEKAADRYQADIEDDPDFDLAENAGLALQSWRPGHKLHEMEEAFRSRLAKEIPLVSHSERAYVTYLNSIRMAYFKQMLGHLRARPDGMTAENMKAVAKHVNNMTGRGTLGKWDKSADFLSDILFSPRFLASRLHLLAGMAMNPLQIATGYRLGKKETRLARQLVAREYTRLTAGMSLVLGLAALAAAMTGGDGEDDEVTFSLDTIKSDFGKMKIGEMRFDLGAGMWQPLVFISRFLRGKKRTSDDVDIQLVGPYKSRSQSRLRLAGQFFRTKLSPLAGFSVDMMAGEDFKGDPVYNEEQFVSMYIPLPVSDIYENYHKLGFTGATAASLANFFGIGSNTYGPVTDQQYSSTIGQDVNVNILFPVADLLLSPFGKRTNPDRFQSDPDFSDLIIDKDQ